MPRGYQRPLWAWSGENNSPINVLNGLPDHWNRDEAPRRRPHYDHRRGEDPLYNEGAYRR